MDPSGEPEKESSPGFDWVTVNPSLPPTERATINRFLALDDLSSTVSDVLDELGIRGAVPASTLRPSMSEGRVVGNAVTIRNVEQHRAAFAAATDRDWRMAEVLALRTASRGDVLLVEGLDEVSNMGGLMASIAVKQGVAGAIVDGGVRDVRRSRDRAFPVWSRSHTPITGKWRSVTTHVNEVVRIGNVPMSAGDLVVADETGICCVPRAAIDVVLVRAEGIHRYESGFDQLVHTDEPIDDLIVRLYGRRPAV